MRFHQRRRETKSRRNAGLRGRNRPLRARTIELLEGREMLAGDFPAAAPWQNPMNSRDVNFDQRVSPFDALLIVNDLLSHGRSHTLDFQAVAPLAATAGAPATQYLDVSGDNRVSPVDVLMVINELVDEELLLVETFPTDMSDNPITTIGIGEQYKLRTVVQDIRDPVAQFAGVFSAAADVTFNSALSSINTGQTVEFGGFFDLVKESSLAPGRATAFASTGDLQPPGNSEQFLFSVVLTATAAGPQMFVPAFSTNPNHENLLYGENAKLLSDQILYVGSTLSIGESISIGNVSQAEDAGTPFNFIVSLSEPNDEVVTVRYATNNGTATTAGNDYVATSGTLTFQPGETMMVVPVTVNSDPDVEPDETFNVVLSNPSPNIAIGTSTGVGTIINDDLPPALAISDATATATSQPSVAVFTVTLSGVIEEQVTVSYASADGPLGIAGTDYDAVSGDLTFVPGGPTTQAILVTILSQTTAQPDKTFFVNLSSPMPDIGIDDASGVGRIISQGISISDATVVEGNDPLATTSAVFTVRLSIASEAIVTVAYATADGTATVADNDYQPASGTLTFQPGMLTQLVTVPVVGDTTPEINERFSVNLSDSDGPPIFSAAGIGTIVNDDGKKVLYRLGLADTNETPLPLNDSLDVGDTFLLQVFVQDVQPEPTGVLQGFLDVTYQAGLVTPLPGTLSFGSAFPNARTGSLGTGLLNDFGALGNAPQPANPAAEFLLYQMQFEAIDVGVLSFVASVAIEDLDIGHETLVYTFNDPVQPDEINLENRSINIGENVIVVGDQSQPESNNLVFSVTRFLPEDSVATVVYTTVNGTAIAGQDYVAKSGTLTFVPGQPETQLITIVVTDDTIDEPNETFSIMLSGEVNADISQVPATGTIEDNDGEPGVSVGNATAAEGANLVFTVSLNAVSGKTVTVAYNTADSTSGIMAIAGVDYTPASGTVTFDPGVVQQTVTVAALNDVLSEPSETFRLLLTNPVNASLGAAQGQGTIIDVPPAGISGIVYVDLNNNGLKEANETGIPGVIVTATRASDGSSKSVQTGADGSYLITDLFPGTYTLKETQPGFYSDGRDTRFGVDSPANDQFSGIVLAASAAEAGFNFGEQGIRSEFISAFINRRALFATAVVAGSFGPTLNMPGTTLNLKTGDIWVSFDGGWSGLRTIEALFNSSQGSASMKLYNNALQEVALSAATSTGAILHYNGQTGSPYFLKISGTNPNVTVQMAELALPSALPATSGGGASGDESPPAADPLLSNSSVSTSGRFASSAPAAQPMIAPDIEPLVSSDASDEALTEDADWLLELLLV